MKKYLRLFKAGTLTVIFCCLSVALLSQPYDEKIEKITSELNDFSITPASSGSGFAILGTMKGSGGNQHGVVIRVDASGNPIWTKVLDEAYDATTPNARFLHIESYPNGYAILGVRQGDPLLGVGVSLYFMTLDVNGNVMTSRLIEESNRIGWSHNFNGLHLIYTDEGGENGFVITGFYYSNMTGSPNTFTPSVHKQMFAMRTDDVGVPVWMNFFNTPSGTQMDMDMGSFVLQTDIGYYITGSANIQKNDNSISQGTLSVMLNFDGSLNWANNFASYDLAVAGIRHEYGAGAVLANNGQEIVVLSYYDSKGYSLTRINTGSGSIIAGKKFTNSDGLNTVGLTIGKNHLDQYVVSGYVKSAVEQIDCTTWTYPSTGPFITVIPTNLSTPLTSLYYPQYAPGFTATGGEVFGPFGGTWNLDRPWIYTPEIASVSSGDGSVALLGYRDAGSTNKYDLQFINAEPPSYSWCRTNPLVFKSEDITLSTQENVTWEESSENWLYSGPSIEDDGFGTASCSILPPVSFGSSFPITMGTTGPSDQVKGRSIGNGHNLIVKNGNIYTGGSFYKQMTNPNLNHSDTYVMGTTTYHRERPWVAKYDSNGNVVWSDKATGSCTFSTITALAVDDQDNLYVAGYFGQGDLKFASDPDTPIVSSTTHLQDLTSFIVKYSSTGTFKWRSVMEGVPITPGSSTAMITDIEIGPSGDVYATGVTSGKVKFFVDANPGTTVTTTNNSEAHAFFGKFKASDGSKVFFESDPSLYPSSEKVYDKTPRTLQVDSRGVMYVAGDDTYKAWVASYDNAIGLSSLATSTASSAPGYGRVNSMKLHNGELYMVGTSVADFTFGGKTFTGLSNDGWFAKMNPATFSISVAGSIKTTGTTFLSDVIVHSDGNVYMVGDITSQATLQYFPSGGTGSWSSNGATDLIVGRFDNSLTSMSGNWSYAGSTANAVGESISIAEGIGKCGVYISGQFSAGDISDLAITNAPAGSFDMFVARINTSGVSYKTDGGSNVTTSDSGDQPIPQAEEQSQKVLSIYPNPASTRIYVEGVERGARVVLIDMKGQILRDYNKVKDDILQIERGNLSAGFYLIKVSDRRSNKVNRILLE